MPTLQAVDLDHFEAVADGSTQLSPTTDFAGAAGEVKASRLRGYFALCTLFAIAGLGYTGLFLMFDHLVALAKS